MDEGEGREDLVAYERCGDKFHLPEDHLYLSCDREKGHAGWHNDRAFTEAFWSSSRAKLRPTASLDR